MNRQAIRQHFAHHRLHMAGCFLAGVLVVAAAVLGAPALAFLGALMCGTMMIGIVWMMVAMGARRRR